MDIRLSVKFSVSSDRVKCTAAPTSNVYCVEGNARVCVCCGQVAMR